MSNIDLSHFEKICHIISTITKMDVRLIDRDGNALLKILQHYVPSMLQGLEGEEHIIQNILHKSPDHAYYYYVNSYGLEYIASSIRKDGCMIIGPFISSISIMDVMKDMIANNRLPVSQRKQLENFYKSLPVITSKEYEAIGDLLVNMCLHEHIEAVLVTGEHTKPLLSKDHHHDNLAESMNIIEMRYELEKKLINAIANGDRHGVVSLSKESADLLDFSNRIPESPIRSAKNISLVLNTICRVAAEKGGVHPVYLHHISERFAILIERAPNLNRLISLGTLMMNEYCDVVNAFSTRNMSPIIKKAVNHIHLNLEAPLTLNGIAVDLDVNPSYLSRVFKEETGMNLIDYIQHKRIEEAKLYLHRGTKSVTEIAFLVGFNDVNYFSRVFKKLTSVTPRQYMKGDSG